MAKKILIVEDDAQVARLLSIQMKSVGYRGINAYDGEEGLRLAKKEKPDLILLDVNLPLIDGNKLCEILKLSPDTKEIKVIMLTSETLVGTMEDSFSAGADVYMNKPYKLVTLLGHIKELIG